MPRGGGSWSRLFAGNLDGVPEAKFITPVVGAVFESEVDYLAREFAKVDFEFEPLRFDRFKGNDLVVEDFAVCENAKLPVAVGMIATANFEEGGFAFGNLELALE
jgi:hypothetical protein